MVFFFKCGLLMKIGKILKNFTVFTPTINKNKIRSLYQHPFSGVA